MTPAARHEQWKKAREAGAWPPGLYERHGKWYYSSNFAGEIGVEAAHLLIVGAAVAWLLGHNRGCSALIRAAFTVADEDADLLVSLRFAVEVVAERNET